jgi:hypothetical protein
METRNKGGSANAGEISKMNEKKEPALTQYLELCSPSIKKSRILTKVLASSSIQCSCP